MGLGQVLAVGVWALWGRRLMLGLTGLGRDRMVLVTLRVMGAVRGSVLTCRRRELPFGR